jgi:ADP-ribose pyrophosphatase
MKLLNILLNEYKIHKKTRTRKHASYPDRFFVPDDKVSWEKDFQEYSPVQYNAQVVLDVNTPWADPSEIEKVMRPFISYEGVVRFSDKGFPLNPFGRTGISGRGILGKWAANFAVDGLITTIHPEKSLFQVLTITRADTGEIAIPGGMVDFGEEPLETRDRELSEELSIGKTDLANPLYENVVMKGYVDDPRNTDNAWMETTVIHTHISYEQAQKLNLSAGDDAKDYQWTDISEETIGKFYASHGLSVLLALKCFLISKTPFIIDQIKYLPFNAELFNYE